MTAAAVAPSRRKPNRRARTLVHQASVILIVLLAWQLAASAEDLGGVPPPLAVFGALVGQFTSGAVWAPLASTLTSWAGSLGLSIAAGISIGFVLGSSRIAYRMSVFLLDFLRTIPALVLVPLVVLLLRSEMESKMLLAFLGAVWAVIMQTIYGARDVDPVARDVFASFRVRAYDRITRLLLPSALPYIATGVRLAAAICLLVTISAEIIIPAGGFGEEIVTHQLGGAVPEMYAYILLCGLLGVVVNLVFLKLESVVLAWHTSHRRGRP